MPWWFFRLCATNASANATAPKPSVVSPSHDETTLPSFAASRHYLDEQPYLLPKDLGEVNRLDFQHYILRAALHGNYLAPIEQPRRILDVGCGTGQWAFELAHHSSSPTPRSSTSTSNRSKLLPLLLPTTASFGEIFCRASPSTTTPSTSSISACSSWPGNWQPSAALIPRESSCVPSTAICAMPDWPG
ncbi:class I SAM-dependent methyltransferase [Thermogemmatispora onikobensis]|uniref:class I SAM-dependent methyltransferase n=1 Tax=Thermogemmatispora onikobensis TaxID=732234 RepID=UPI00114D0991|nr:class I SAM-dependent methyltransferase [Thermogemmatispora onikobensis]